MLEKSLAPVFYAIILLIINLLIEYRSGYFANATNPPRPIHKWRLLFYSCLLILVALILISNFVYFIVISPRFLNTAVITASSIVTLLLLMGRLLRSPASLRIPASAFASRLLWLWPLLLILTAGSAKASPRYLIVVLPVIGSNPNIDIGERIERYLEQGGRSEIAVREIPCIGSCPLPSSILDDSRVLLVIASEVKQDNKGSSTLSLGISANCRREPSPVERKYTAEPECTYVGTFPYDQVNDNYLDAYLPILLLSSISTTEGSESDLLGLVNQAIDALDYASAFGDDELAWSLHEKLFYDLLYIIPNLSPKQRVDSAGEVRARAARLFETDTRVTLLTARWYEESGIIDSNNYERAISKYQEAVGGEALDDLPLYRLAIVSEKLYRNADAICYTSEVLKLRPSSEDQLRLVSLLERLGVSEIPDETGRAHQTPQMIRQNIQEAAVRKSDASSIDEFFSLSEISLDNRNFEEALKYIEQILDRTNLTPGERATAYFQEGRIRIAQSDFDRGIEAFTRFLDIALWERFNAANLEGGYSSLGFVYHGRGFYSESADAYQKALNYTNKPERRAALLAHIAHETYGAGRLNDSLSLFAQSKKEFESLDLEKYPLGVRIDYNQMLYNYAEIVQDPVRRAEYYQSVAQFYSDLAEDIKQSAASDFGGCVWVSEQLYGGIEQPYEYLRAYSSEPSVPDEYYRKVRTAYLNLGRLDEAREYAELEIERLERSAQTAVDYHHLGLAFLSIEEYQAAIDAMQQAIDLDNPGLLDDVADATDYYYQGLAYTELFSYTLAVDALAIAVRIQSEGNPILAVTYYGALANAYRHWGNETEDSDKFLKALDSNRLARELPVSDDTKSRLWFDAGLIYLDWSQYDASHYPNAISAWMQAIMLDNAAATALGSDSADALDWSYIGITYRDWGKASGDVEKYEEAVNAHMKALNLYQSDDSKAEEWDSMGLTYLEWARQDGMHFSDAIHAWTEAIRLDGPETSQNDEDSADALYWSYIGITYRDWGKASGDVEKYEEAINAHMKALNLYQSGEWKAGQWFNVGLTYLEWARQDGMHFSDAIHAWTEAIRLDNPDASRYNQDPRDVADWYEMAITYQEWAKLDPKKMAQAIESVEKALSIPIQPADPDYHWYQQAERLKDELTRNK